MGGEEVSERRLPKQCLIRLIGQEVCCEYLVGAGSDAKEATLPPIN